MNKILKTCIVDVDNEFVFNGMLFRISKRNKNYKVMNSYKDNKDYTNSSDMISVHVGIEKESCTLFFLDENKNKMNDVFFVKLVGV